METMTKHEKANTLIRLAIDALVDAITDDVKELTKNGAHTLNIDVSSYDMVFTHDDTLDVDLGENDKITISDDVKSCDIGDVTINDLIDISNAILCGNYCIHF
jgi:hypothetical protein